MRSAPRSVYGASAELVHAHFRARAAAGLLGLFTVGGAAAVGFGLIDPLRGHGHGRAALAAGLAGLALAYLTARGVRVATVLLVLLAAVDVGVAAVAAGGAGGRFWGIYTAVLVGAVVLVPGVLHARHAFALAARRRDLAEELGRGPRAGDLYSVRDGARFAVVKVLDADDARVHVRQFAPRLAERPWRVRTSDLTRAPGAARRPPGWGDGPAYAHLPLDRAEFQRWEPVRLRTEPPDPDEMRALAAWRAVHEPASPAPAT